MAQTGSIAHLREAFSLAQFLVSERDAAADLVGRAFSAALPEGLGRFTVLRAVVRTWGGLVDATHEMTPDEAPPTLEGAVDDVPLVGVLAGRSLRDRLLPSVIGSLSTRDRLMVWFTASGIEAPTDVALVLGSTPDQAAEWARSAEITVASRLFRSASLPDRILLAAAERAEPSRDAVRRLIGTLLEPPPAGLVQRVETLLQIRNAPRQPISGTPVRWRRFVLLTGLVAAIGVVGYGIQSLRPDSEPAPPRSRDAVRLALDLADAAEPVFRTSSAEQAEIFVRDRLSWSLVAPVIQGSAITGVGLVDAVDGLQIPILFYGNGPGYRVTVVAYTYEFLDRAAPALTLERTVRTQIGEPGRFAMLDVGSGRALVFRNRDDIFVAVTPGDLEALQEAVSFPD